MGSRILGALKVRSRASGRARLVATHRQRPARWLLVVGLICASSAACNKPKQEAAPEKPSQKHGLSAEQAKLPLVVIGDETVTLGQFAEQIAEKSPYLRARYASPARRRELLDELVKFELMANEAKRRGLEKSEDVERAKRTVMVQQMMKAEFEDKLKLSDIGDAEIEAYYKAHPEEFNKPAQVRASQIVLKDEGKAKRVLKLASEAKDEEAFRKLVSEYSEDAATKAEGGDLHFFSRPEERAGNEPEIPAAVANAAFKLENSGDVHPELVQTPQGFHVVRLVNKRKALARTLDHARRMIQNKLWREKREAAVDAFMQDLRKKAKIEEHLDLLEQVHVDLPDTGKDGKSARVGGTPGAAK